MTTTQIQKDARIYRLEIVSTTVADLLITHLDGTLIEHRQYVGSRAEALALVAWTTATGLVVGRKDA